MPEDGLAAYGDDGDDLMLALPRKIVACEEDADSVESVFAQARQVAAEAEALLVDEGWHAPEPAVVEAEAVGVAGDRDDLLEEADERQRTLFSWTEFMVGEPDEPPKPRRRDEAPTLSLFRGGAGARTGEPARESGLVDGRAGDIAGGVPRSRPCMRGFVR